MDKILEDRVEEAFRKFREAGHTYQPVEIDFNEHRAMLDAFEDMHIIVCPESVTRLQLN